jgi:hypothetical protein
LRSRHVELHRREEATVPEVATSTEHDGRFLTGRWAGRGAGHAAVRAPRVGLVLCLITRHIGSAFAVA